MFWVGAVILAAVLMVAATLLARRNARLVVEPADVALPTDRPGRSYPSLPGDFASIPKSILHEAPFDVSPLLIPISTNGNAAPLYLDALYEFLPEEMAACVSVEERRARGRELRERHARTTFLQTRDRRTIRVDERDNLVAEYQTAFEKLAIAQQCKFCIFESPLGIDGGVVPHALAARAVMNVLDWKTSQDLAEERIDCAINDVELALRLSRDLRPRAALICQLVSVGIDMRTLDHRVRWILNSRQLQIGDCDQLIEILTRHGELGVDPLAEALRVEYFHSRDVLRRLEMQEDVAARMGSPNTSYGTVLANASRAFDGATERDYVKLAAETDAALAEMTTADYVAEIDALNRYYGPLIALADRRERALDQPISELERSARSPKLNWRGTSAMPLCVEAFRRSRIRHAGTQCLVALRRWNLENPDFLPTDLLSVCQSAGMNSVPLDEYCGEPLRWNVIDGDVVIYSVGPDGKDDKGLVVSNHRGAPGDWVFRLPSASSK